MSEEEPRARPYPSWPEICNPLQKLYDPFEEYSAYDGQKNNLPEPPKDRIDWFVREYGYFSNTRNVEILDPHGAMPQKQQQMQEEETPRRRDKPKEYGPFLTNF